MVQESDAVFRHREYFLAKGRQFHAREMKIDKAFNSPAANPSDKVELQKAKSNVRFAGDLEKKQIEHALDSDKSSFVATLPEDISQTRFMNVLDINTTSTDEKVLGNDYEEQIAEAILYPSVFAEFPATFDTVAIAGIIDMVGSSEQEKLFNPEKDILHTDEVIDRTGYLTNRMLVLGSIEFSHEDRFMIPPKKKRKLMNILEKFD